MRFRPWVLALLSAVLILGVYLGALQLSGNFHTVVPGELYRSGQLSPQRLARYVRRYGIETVVNLRGPNRGRKWYDDEVAETARLQVGHVDFRMTAGSDFSVAQAREVIRILKTAPKPILIHCQGGADRSGLIAGIYLQAIDRKGEDAAEDQLSLVYGHIAVPFLFRAYAMNRSWEELEPFLGIKGS